MYPSSGLRTISVEQKKVNSSSWGGRSFRTDLGIPRATRNVNLLELESSEQYSVLSPRVAEPTVRDSTKHLIPRAHRDVNVEDYRVVRSQLPECTVYGCQRELNVVRTLHTC